MIKDLPLSHLALLVITFILGITLFLFFLAWSVSKMPSLNKTPADVAIPSMNALNKAVKNPFFLGLYFLTPVMYIGCGLLSQYIVKNSNALLFYLAAIIYVIGVVIVTSSINEPLNYQLAQKKAIKSPIDTQEIWQTYANKWQFWNNIRTISSGLSLGLFVCGLLILLRNY